MEEDGNGRGLGPGSPSTSVGQFSFAPATRTTVVTTTTTTTTTFPPVLIRPPRATQDLDPKVYPLASAPTPSALRNIRFELGGKSVVFNEPEDAAGTLNELHEKNDALKTSNGLVRSVASFTSDDTQLSRRLAHRTSNQPSNHLSISKRRLTEAQQGSLRARSARVPSEPSFRPARSHGSTPVHPTVAGLATPETETNSNNAMEGILSRRRIHSASNARRETLLRSPLSSEVESQGPSQTVDARKETLRTNTIMQEHDRQSGCANETGFARPALERTGSDPRQHLTGIAASQDSGYDAPGDNSQHLPTESSSQPFIDNIVAQDMCLPSPSLSPVAALNAANIDSSFDSGEDQEDTDSSFDNSDSRFIGPLPVGDSNGEATYVAKPEQLAGPMMQRPTSMMDIPNVLDFFDSVPDSMKTYMMYQFLRRCPKQTLHFVADVVNPALKCDFLSLLPLELSLNIVKYFDVQTMCRAAQVSKKWRHIINSDEKSWKELFDRDGYVLPEGELDRAIREGWGWQFPNGCEDFEKDMSMSPFIKPDPESSVPALQAFGESSDRTLSVSRRPKRKACTRVSSRKLSKRKISSSGTDHSESSDWRKEVSASEGPYAAANAAAAAVPYPEIGLPSLRGLHLYKSLYQRHHSIHQAWMKPVVKPRHIAFRAHDRHVVTCLQFDTEKVLTGSDDTNINVYDTRTGELKATLEGHEGGVWALEYYGNTLVSGSTDRSVRVWDIEKARCTQIFHGHTSTVRCLQIVLPVEVGKKADGTPEMMPKEPLIITGSRDSNLRVWKLPKPGDPGYYQSGPHVDDTDCPYFVRVLTGHQHSVRAIAAHGDTLVSGSYDCTVRVWKISTGETVHRLQGHTLKVYSVVLDHKRNRCISGSMDNMVKVWSLETGSILYNLEGHTSLVGLLDLKCDRLVSAAADSTLRIWDPETGQCRNMLSAHTGAITCFQHDGQKVISGSDRTLKMWDVKTGDCVRDLLTDLSGVWQVKFNDRRCVAAVQRDSLTYIEVLDFGASRDGVPSEQLGRRIVVNRWGQEVSDTDEDYDLSDA
ncbi:SCF ubiquitin ligase complex subunit cdc4 [Aspergillus tubingensis]|uniref:Probable E3 ubiquitin ligase complex SCF subunit sconB n=2 Tax=Aspergillus subgen. Circumdati TaxID=2720871 RepID=A0A100IQ49_ASPNG|nr:cell division control protein Cdc4 [Aspergillus niger]GLA59978.1 SCF ubiquitin ligase complex subunit cdc4 [Aspergillus tubingensis]GLA79441.1 SCF ubiquitin ligase complex subunit cdc4 [Aspergillus tubingensis]GLB16313.1 SCF ubiquitin ligase complex subunit cdc4 [Aspergillus tubingensis]